MLSNLTLASLSLPSEVSYVFFISKSGYTISYNVLFFSEYLPLAALTNGDNEVGMLFQYPPNNNSLLALLKFI